MTSYEIDIKAEREEEENLLSVESDGAQEESQPSAIDLTEENGITELVEMDNPEKNRKSEKIKRNGLSKRISARSPSKSDDSSTSSSPSSSISTDVSEKTQHNSKQTRKRKKVEDNTDTVDSKKQKTGSNISKKEKQINDFVLGVLPALKKDLKGRKQSAQAFKIRDHSNYFTPSSNHIATFILPLFHFLGKEEVICHRYGNFNGKHMVKTNSGFERATFLVNNANIQMSDEEKSFLMSKFGKEWFKIPSKDVMKVNTAHKYGEKGEFKISLIGLYEDSFLDESGHEVFTINPILKYEPYHPAPSKKKESKSKE